jgi:hypothetical protein
MIRVAPNIGKDFGRVGGRGRSHANDDVDGPGCRFVPIVACFVDEVQFGQRQRRLQPEAERPITPRRRG